MTRNDFIDLMREEIVKEKDTRIKEILANTEREGFDGLADCILAVGAGVAHGVVSTLEKAGFIKFDD